MKFALIGQDIPMLLPSLLTDALFANKVEADIFVEEKNAVMQDVLQGYADALVKQSGVKANICVLSKRDEVLSNADAVIYAGDVMAGSRFRMDREALTGVDEDDPFGMTAQARVNGGIGGLLHTLRQGNAVYDLCDQMKKHCPNAIVISMGQPVGRTTGMFLHRGFQAYGLASQVIKGPNGLDRIAEILGKKNAESVYADVAGLPGFSFLLGLRNLHGGNILNDLDPMIRAEKMGRLCARWLKQYGAIAVGDIPGHAEWLPDQEDFIPDKDPQFGESVERRKERILYMNTIREKGLDDQEAKMAQLLLLSKASALRPIQLAVAVLQHKDANIPSVVRKNDGELSQLPRDAIIESRFEIKDGEVQTHHWSMPSGLADICLDIDYSSRLAVQAASGDRSALRECIETDPALEGYDRLYVQDVVEKMIEMHSDIITCFDQEEDEY